MREGLRAQWRHVLVDEWQVTVLPAPSPSLSLPPPPPLSLPHSLPRLSVCPPSPPLSSPPLSFPLPRSSDRNAGVVYQRKGAREEGGSEEEVRGKKEGARERGSEGGEEKTGGMEEWREGGKE